MFRRTNSVRQTDADHAEERLRALIDEHSPSAYRLALSIVRDRALAEDVVQETMLKVWRSLDTWNASGSQRAWVLSIAHNTAVSTLRRIRDEAIDPGRIPDRVALGDNVERSVESLEALAILRIRIGRLDDLSREILILRDAEGLSYQSIAEALSVSVAVVKTRLLRARRELRSSVVAPPDDVALTGGGSRR